MWVVFSISLVCLIFPQAEDVFMLTEVLTLLRWRLPSWCWRVLGTRKFRWLPRPVRVRRPSQASRRRCIRTLSCFRRRYRTFRTRRQSVSPVIWHRSSASSSRIRSASHFSLLPPFSFFFLISIPPSLGPSPSLFTSLSFPSLLPLSSLTSRSLFLW